LFTALSGAWTSTADRTSSTGSKTLQSVLDPGNTGQMQVFGSATVPITLTASSTSANSGNPITLTWNATGATACTAWGGTSGDGWAGPQAASGSVVLTSSTGGAVTYALNCLIGPQIGAGSVVVNWDFLPPYVDLTGGSQGPLTLGASTGTNWESNVQPCVASGGVAGDGWAGAQPTSGSFATTVTQLGLTQYTLTCGTGSNSATASVGVYGVEPYVTLVSRTPQVITGSSVDLNWFTYGTGAHCTQSGGSPNEGWANQAFGPLSESVPGTYIYTITCTGGGQTATSSQTVVVTSGTPAISLTAPVPQQQIETGALDLPALDLVWSSNIDDCVIDYTSNSGLSQAIVLTEDGTTGAVTDSETSPGVITYTLECGTLTASTTIDWVANAPPAVLSVSDMTWAAQVAYPLSWNSSAGPCSGSGGASGDGWAGPKTQTGTQSVSESQPGTYMFTLTCGSGGAATTSNVAIQVPVPFIQMYSSPGITPGTELPETIITWSATVGPCTYVDGSSANSVGIIVPPTGSATPSPSASGLYVFTLQCGAGANTLYAATVAPVQANAPTTLSVSVTSAAVDAPITITWSSAGSICYAMGGTGLAPWVGTLPGIGSGSLIVTSANVGSITYGVSCAGQIAQAMVNYVAVPATSAEVAAPSVTLSSSDSTETAGQSVSLTWSSKNAASCSASDGNPGDGWTGTLMLSGSLTVTETAAGAVTYSITCVGAPPAATASTSVVFVTASATAPAASSSHGGGSLDPLCLLLLAVLVGVSLSRTMERAHSPAQTVARRRPHHTAR
jgi:hypothetical protein